MGWDSDNVMCDRLQISNACLSESVGGLLKVACIFLRASGMPSVLCGVMEFLQCLSPSGLNSVQIFGLTDKRALTESLAVDLSTSLKLGPYVTGI